VSLPLFVRVSAAMCRRGPYLPSLPLLANILTAAYSFARAALEEGKRMIFQGQVQRASAIAGAALVLILTGCGPQTPEAARAAAIDKCERKFGKVAPDPTKGTALCTCLTDKLAAEGLEITDMLGGDREKVEGLMRSCATSAGVSLPQR
jgi:hypothetical protein